MVTFVAFPLQAKCWKYYECPFKFYADKILSLNEYKNNIASRLGTYAHAVLEESYKEDFDFNSSVINNTIDNAIDDKDKFYFKQMEIVLRQLIEFNKKYESYSALDSKELEPKIEYDFGEFKFEGYVDKILYTEINNEIYAAIIDYKTGKDIASLDNVTDGFNLQLPSYVFLLSKYKKFENKKINILGIYLQKVKIIALNDKMDVVKQREKSFKLLGYTTSLQSYITMLDPTYFSSSYISGMSVVKSGNFGQYAKVITPSEMELLTTIVEDLIVNAGESVLAGKFDIEPKLIDKKNKSCTYCEYYDLCYHRYSDLKELEVKYFPAKEDKWYGMDTSTRTCNT